MDFSGTHKKNIYLLKIIARLHTGLFYFVPATRFSIPASLHCKASFGTIEARVHAEG
jgi:hypothetical protein